MFYTAMWDAVFKSVFCKEENRDLLKKLIECSLGKEVEIIDIKPPEILKRNFYVKNKTLDVLVKCEGKIINIEITSGFYSGLHRRNAGYIFTKYGEDVKIGKDYEKMNEHIQINFTLGLANDVPILGKYELIDKNSNIHFIDNLTIYEYNMNRINELKGKDSNFLKMLNADKKELSKLSKGDDLMEKFKNEVETLNEDPLFIDWISPEEDALKVQNTLIQNEKKQEKIKIAKNMLKDNIDIENISKYTGLSKEELEALK